MSTIVTPAPQQRTSEFVVTIDGPAGAGKSSVARRLASHFGFAFLDTGAMYRALTLAYLQKGLDWKDSQAIVETASHATIAFEHDRVLLDGRDVTQEIRLPEVNAHIRYVADHPEIRSLLGTLQRAIAKGRQIATEGRDQGTEIFPDAACKIFLTATPETRAQRRFAEISAKHPDLTVADVLASQQRRDEEDAQRPVGALRPAEDAEIFYTDDLTQDEVVRRLAEIVNRRRSNLTN